MIFGGGRGILTPEDIPERRCGINNTIA